MPQCSGSLKRMDNSKQYEWNSIYNDIVPVNQNVLYLYVLQFTDIIPFSCPRMCFPANLVSDVVCVLFVLRVGSLKG